VRSLADSSYDDAISNVALPASATAAVTAASAHSHPSRTQSDTVQPSGKIEATDSKHAKKRKLYLCGKCGVPKRGHICSNPDVTESRDESSTIGATLSDSSKKYNKVVCGGSNGHCQTTSIAKMILPIPCTTCGTVLRVDYPDTTVSISCPYCSAVMHVQPQHNPTLQTSLPIPRHSRPEAFQPPLIPSIPAAMSVADLHGNTVQSSATIEKPLEVQLEVRPERVQLQPESHSVSSGGGAPTPPELSIPPAGPSVPTSDNNLQPYHITSTTPLPCQVKPIPVATSVSEMFQSSPRRKSLCR